MFTVKQGEQGEVYAGLTTLKHMYRLYPAHLLCFILQGVLILPPFREQTILLILTSWLL